jgi:broad specificity phosphatase PhoE
MPANRIHLVRHGEVDNPNGVLYGRLPNFALTALGRQMAEASAIELASSTANITRLISSPLLRTLQSARPISEQLNLSVSTENLIIEPTNIFEGKKVGLATVTANPAYLLKLYNPLKPSWGEPYKQIVARMTEALRRAWDETATGEVVMISHQLPIWALHLAASRRPLWHDPRSRRCDLSSITSFEFVNNKLVEVDYRDPAKALRTQAVDSGAV